MKTWTVLNRGNELSGYLKGEEIVDYLSDCHLVKQVNISRIQCLSNTPNNLAKRSNITR